LLNRNHINIQFMAKFLNTRKAVSEMEDLIRNAGEKLILISPYLRLSKDFKELLTYRNSKDKITTVIFGKSYLKPDEMSFLQELRFVILKYNEDLHAKCYVNEDKMIITSLNLYEFSMANNKEMGVLIDKNDQTDAQLFEDAFKEVDYINETSKRFEFSTVIKQTDEKPVKKSETPISYKPSGKYVSTSALSKEMKISSKELFAKFEKLGLIQKNFDEWELTKRGEKMGGQVKNGQYGQYIAWAENIKDVIDAPADALPF